MTTSETRGLFPDVPSEIDFPKAEQKTLAFWQERRIFERTVEERKGSEKGTFVFYEGPPTANGLPHNGHVLTRVMKDIFPRYKTMLGYEVPRKAGWDTHGLPVEVEVEKELRIHGKAAIEAYGIEPFTARCIESVFRYTTEWERLTDRIGFWVDQKDAYVTFHRSYVESVWWALAELWKKGLLYRGHKVVWWWAQGGTALSSGEVGQGYKTVVDPSAYVAFPLLDDPEGRALIVWTTTPWTLSSNAYAAVRADLDYVHADLGDRKIIVAEKLLAPLAEKLKLEPVIEKRLKGSDLVGLSYVPPFDLYASELRESTPYFKVVAADFVTLDAGTGIVHLAPAFGEDDFNAHRKLTRGMEPAPPLLCAVAPDGTFLPEMGKYAGRWVKDCDRELAKDLDARGLLVLLEDYKHEYPFCWRADEDPLIQFARPAWYIKTTAKNAEAIANNRAVDWKPEHIKEGRFGDFLANNVDWALSRERFWGTPLPIWENAALPEEHPDRYVAISSLTELRAQVGQNIAEVEQELATHVTDKEAAHHLLVHKPWIDKITFTRPGVEGSYKRVTEVIDCWFDSGCMPFAQWGFPHAEGSQAQFQKAFPADFISEAIDQTRGWFYSLLMISTLLFDEQKQKELGLTAGGNYPHPYKTCIVLGHVADKEGKKESKSKGNYTPPEVILDTVQMDFAVSAAWKNFTAKDGQALIAPEDFEGLDLKPGCTVKIASANGEARSFALVAQKGMARRIVVLSEADRQSLGVVVGEKVNEVRPVEVPGLPADQRVSIADETMPAPGADAFRWFFYAASPPWSTTRHSLSNVRALQKDFQVKLRNVFSFFTIYANIDQWTPALSAPPVAERPLLCRWILSELALTVEEVRARMDGYGVYEAAQRLGAFVESLSNWYVRRSRERFWVPGVGEAMADDKRAAYATLHTCLVTLAKLSAPFVPFFAEELYQGLVVAPKMVGAVDSVHLAAYPEADTAVIDKSLSEAMAAVRELTSLGLLVRNGAKRKVRQPLRKAEIVPARADLAASLQPYLHLIAEELNVHEVGFLPPGQEGKEVRYKVKPNFRTLGAKLGKRVQEAKKALEKLDAASARTALVTDGKLLLALSDDPADTVELLPEDVEVAVEAEEGFAAAGGRAGVVILHTALDQELLDEGLAREIGSRLAAMRKDLGLGFVERVAVAVDGSPRVVAVATKFQQNLAENVLADRFELAAPTGDEWKIADGTVDGEAFTLAMKRA
jgi:isoleucyl-tRNA synthetase